jgi:hypothetical protein
MVVDQRVSRRGDEVAAVPEILGRVPDQLDHLRRSDHRVPLLVQLKILVTDEIKEHCVEWLRTGELVGPVVARADEDVGRRVGEITIVLTIHEEEVHADARRIPLERVRHPQKERHPRSAVVGSRNGALRIR